MNSREIVQRTLDFDYPERVAHSFPQSDFIKVRVEVPRGEWHITRGDEWERVDAWGNVWGRVDKTSKGEVVRGALADLDQAETFPLPDLNNPDYYRASEAQFAQYPDRWPLAVIEGFSFSIARKLRRLDQYFMDLMTEPEKIAILHDRIDEQIRAQMRQIRTVGAAGFIFGEDWGTQERMFIHPRLWRKEFKPRFAALCDYAHELGLIVFMHSCGKITEIIPDLIEVGVDLLQFDQPTVHRYETLAAFQQNHKISFWCPVDIQAVLPSGDDALIRQHASAMLDNLWRGRGGFIAGFYEDMPSIGVAEAWQQVASDEFLRHGQRENFLPAR